MTQKTGVSADPTSGTKRNSEELPVGQPSVSSDGELTLERDDNYAADMADDDVYEESPYGDPREREKPLILIADDDPEIRRLLAAFFSDQDCDLIESSDGADALENIIVNRPNLVVLDVMMPELNGWQICKYVKSREDYHDVGIIMLTAIGPVNNELTSPLFGADDYIDKPFDFDELEFKVRKVLADKRKAPADD